MSRLRGTGQALDLPRTSDGRPIVSRADLETYDPSPRRSGGRERYYCPVHGGDHQRSLTVDPATGHYTCHACKASGTLREHWPDAYSEGTQRRAAVRPLSVEERGRRALRVQARVEEERAERAAASIPHEAAAFLCGCESMTTALRAPGCPGALYLRARGLDPECAAALGAGYAAPAVWPGDRGRAVGRIIYPLADPATGRLVSAAGRLAVDPAPAWGERYRTAFKHVKQRKLTGCAAGVWPYASLAAARKNRRPLIVVEGPADALALLQYAGPPLDVIALMGTASVLTAAALRDLPGVVLALDADDGGTDGARSVWTELALAGIPAVCVASGWLGAAKDAGELPRREQDTAGSYARAVALVHAACEQLRRAGSPARAWSAEAASAAFSAMVTRCAAAWEAMGGPCPPFDEEIESAIDAAYEAHDWAALRAALHAQEQTFMAALSPLVEQEPLMESVP